MVQKTFTSLEFDQIRSNLREYMESQDTLKDYNFDGSVASTLLDILAWNTLYNATYANMTASERFLSTAQLRPSVVALAKNIGYVPRSRKAAKANVTLSVEWTGVGSPSTVTVPANTKFRGRDNEGTSYTFFNREAVYLTNSSGSTYTGTFDIYEGKAFTYRETFESGERGVTLPNKGIDTDLLTVLVRPNPSSSTSVRFSKSSDFSVVTGQTNVYFVEEVDAECHRIYFGDDIIGTQVNVGNQVEVQYFVSSGADANNISSFTLIDTIANTNTNSTTTNENSSGGKAIEDIESIRTNAPKFYQAQNRAVTPRDYEAIIEAQFSFVKDVAVWGGEDSVPPSYGKVFVAAIPEFGEFLSSSRKNEIKEFLTNEYSVMTITPDIVDPDYLFLEVTNNIDFATSESSLTPLELQSQVRNVFETYNNNELKEFEKNFRKSKVGTLVDAVDSTIISNDIDVILSIRPPDIEDVSVTNTLTYCNPIEAGTLTTSLFDWTVYQNVFLEDDSNGNLNIYRSVAGVKTPINDALGNILVAGTVDYLTGDIVFDKNVFNVLDIKKVYLERLRINAEPTNSDIKAVRRQILQICNSCLTVNITDTTTNVTV